MRSLLKGLLLLSILICLAAVDAADVCAQSGADESARGKADSMSTVSITLLQERLKAIEKEIRDLRIQKKKYERVRDSIAVAKTKIDQRKLPRQDQVANAVGELKKTGVELKGLTKQLQTEGGKKALDKLRGTVGTLHNLFRDDADDFPGYGRLPGLTQDEFELYLQLEGPSRRTPGSNPVRASIPRTMELLDPFPPFRTEADDKLVQAVVDEIQGLEVAELMKKAESNLNAMKEHMAEVERAAKKKIDDIDTEIKSQEKQLSDTDALLKQRETTVGVLNERLTWAVYFMIAAIVILFIILRTFGEPLAARIIRERTMIELLSMGFLLLTVIILGTGGKLTGEALAALLGTIAGYIFGRKEAEWRQRLSSQAQQPAVPAPSPGRPGSQPVPAPAPVVRPPP